MAGEGRLSYASAAFWFEGDVLWKSSYNCLRLARFLRAKIAKPNAAPTTTTKPITEPTIIAVLLLSPSSLLFWLVAVGEDEDALADSED